jgi:putative transcriptional regulator
MSHVAHEAGLCDVSGSGSTRVGVAEPSVDALLAAYAAGSLSEPLAVLVAAHLQMKPENRAYVAALEAAGGAHIDTIAPVPLSGRDRRLDSIYAAPQRETPTSGTPNVPSGKLLPPILDAYAGRAFEACKWRWLGLGLRRCVLRKDAGCEVSFLRCRAGKNLPAHTHDGLEATLVLAGGYSDAFGHYRPGDMAVADENVEHRPLADRDGECLVFLVLEGSMRMTGPVGRLWQRIAG